MGNFYLSNFMSNNKKSIKFPLEIVLCKNCYLLQLKHNAPRSLLYSENYGYRSGINQTMKQELKEIVEKSLNMYGEVKKVKSVIDIGTNDGTLLSYYPKSVFRVGIDPIKKFKKESKKHANIIISDYFSYKNVKQKMKNKKADIITAISCFYDMENPNTFIEDVKKVLDERGIFVIQQNYLVEMLTQNAIDNIVHEHLEYYSLMSLQNLLERHGLQVFDLELRDLNGGSIRTYVGFAGKHSISASVIKQVELEKLLNLNRKKAYVDFANRVKSIKKKLNAFIIEKVNDGKKIYVYGASTRGNTLLQYFNLNNKLINKAAERNSEKWGTKIASVGIPIISEAQARHEKPEYMLVLPWFFREEFLKREKKYLDSGGHFIFPLPEFEVI